MFWGGFIKHAINEEVNGVDIQKEEGRANLQSNARYCPRGLCQVGQADLYSCR